MGLKSYLSDIWEAVATTAKGMRITAGYGVDPRETITQEYPEVRREPSERFRGFLHNDIVRCTSCTMCVRVCPIDCISLESIRGADKKLKLVSYDINIGRCMYCGLCVEVCPPKSLTHTEGYEKASTERGELILHFVHEDAAEIKARVAREVAEAAAKAEAEKQAAEARKAAEAPADEAKPADLPAPPVPKPAPAAPAFAAGNPGSDAERKEPAPETKPAREEASGTPGGEGEKKE